MDKSVATSIGLVTCLYLVWMWSVFAEPPVSDVGDWPKTDFTRTSVDLQAMVDGGPGKNGIVALDQPAMETIKQAQSWLHDREPVVVFTHAGEARAYPLQILMYHEIVNDNVGGEPIAVTYCPLCNAAMVFARRVQNNVLTFAVSGKVYNSNLVMYDRQSESWWLQFTGEGIVGEHMGATLEQLPAQIVSFAEFSNHYPRGKVLSRRTGHNNKYGVNPYTHYDSRKTPVTWFYRKPFDNRLPAMQRILGVVVGQQAVAFPLPYLSQSALVNTQVAGSPIVIVSKSGMASAVDQRLIRESKDVLAAAAFSRMVNGQQLDFVVNAGEIIDQQTGSVWNLFGQAVRGELKGARLQQVDRGVYFSFVWLDFYPQSTIAGL